MTLRVFPLKARYIIPISGMIVGNSMVVVGLVFYKSREKLSSKKNEIEAYLCLGATKRQATSLIIRSAIKDAMLPILDNTKTVGLISLPGAMTGMILAGASPLEAVKLQVVVMYMLVGAASISAISSVFLAYRQFFTKADQLLI